MSNTDAQLLLQEAYDLLKQAAFKVEQSLGSNPTIVYGEDICDLAIELEDVIGIAGELLRLPRPSRS